MNKSSHIPTKKQIMKLAYELHDEKVPEEVRYKAFELILSHSFFKSTLASAIDIITTYKTVQSL